MRRKKKKGEGAYMNNTTKHREKYIYKTFVKYEPKWKEERRSGKG
jgi:hypothetical protein